MFDIYSAAMADEFAKIKAASSVKQVQLADEAFKLLKKRHPEMSIGELAARATRRGREGTLGPIRKRIRAFAEAEGTIGGKEFRKNYARLVKDKTPGKAPLSSELEAHPGVWNPKEGRKATAKERFQAAWKEGY